MAIGLSITDIIRILLGIYTHKIQLKSYCVTSIKNQQTLNLNIQDLVKKEIIKWLDVGVVYPITDIKWVSLVQYVPKICGIIVVSNNNNNFIPMRQIIG